jgi:hypothetical protein
MLIKGTCHCGKVKFEVEAYAPVPYNLCYCSICRKTAGSGGYAINLGALTETLKVTGKSHITTFHAIRREAGEEEKSEAERSFCKHCGTALWLYSPTWPDLIHPNAGCIDTDLPEPPSRNHNMTESKANWVDVCTLKKNKVYEEFAPDSLKEWHEKHGYKTGKA